MLLMCGASQPEVCMNYIDDVECVLQGALGHVGEPGARGKIAGGVHLHGTRVKPKKSTQ